MKLARVLSVVGRTMIAVGVLILLFVAYQLWGTGIRERQAQDRLENRFNQILSEQDGATLGSTAPPVSTPTDGTSTTATLPVQTATPPATLPSEGDPVGKIAIPKIGLDAIIVEGVAVDDLKDGPGHYAETPLPGEKGNVAIAGHRTTYGAPFARVDELDAGDQIDITTIQGTFHYKVTGSQIVSPSAVQVLNDQGDNRLTLTACHPKFSASKRIVISASLEGDPVPAPVVAHPRPANPQALSVSGEKAEKLPTVLLGLVCALIWLVAWLVGRHWRKWPSYLIALPFFLVALFYFFENFSRLLPANY